MDVADQAGIDKTMIDLDGTDNKGIWRQRDFGRFLGRCKSRRQEAGVPLYVI